MSKRDFIAGYTAGVKTMTYAQPRSEKSNFAARKIARISAYTWDRLLDGLESVGYVMVDDYWMLGPQKWLYVIDDSGSEYEVEVTKYSDGCYEVVPTSIVKLSALFDRPEKYDPKDLSDDELTRVDTLLRDDGWTLDTNPGFGFFAWYYDLGNGMRLCIYSQGYGYAWMLLDGNEVVENVEYIAGANNFSDALNSFDEFIDGGAPITGGFCWL